MHKIRRWLNIALINIAVFVVLALLIEAGFRLHFAFSNEVPPSGDLSMTREWKWVKSRLHDGKVNFDSRFQYDSDMGWKNAFNIDETPKFQGNIRTNSVGMRNDQEFSETPTPGKPRLMIVGDSYSFGFGVSNQETYAYELARLMPGWEVMNLAVSATGTDQHYLMYEKMGQKYHPDIVILGFYVLDYNRNTYSFRDYAKPMFIPDSDGALRLTNVPVVRPENLIEEYRSGKKQIGGWYYSYFLAFVKQELSDRLKRDRSAGSLARRTLTGIMEQFAQRVRNNGAVPVWVIFPIDDILESGTSKYAEISEFSKSEASRLGMPVLDLEPVYRDYVQSHPKAPSLWRPAEIGGHLSAEGNKVAGQAIHKFLMQKNLLANQ